METIIFHIDVNSAFLSWSSVDNLYKVNGNGLDLRKIPAIIGGDKANRHGIVLAKSESAKKFGINTAEPVVSAFKKCPTLTMQAPDHNSYKMHSKELMDLLHTYTPDIEQLSIDECFLDFTPISSLYESPLAAATLISNTIKERFHFTVNIGIAPNKLLAKMASDFQKPDRIHTLYYEEIPTKMWPLPVDELYMVGKSSASRLKSFGIRTIGQLAHTDIEFLKREFKSHGILMWEYANGIDHSIVDSSERERKGVGNSITLKEDVSDENSALHVLLNLSESVSKRLRSSKQIAQSVTVEIKYSDFTTCSHQMPFFSPTNSTNCIYDSSCQLFQELWDKNRPIRLLGIRTNKLLPEDAPIQMNIFDFQNNTKQETNIESNKLKQLDHAIDTIRNKYGDSAVVRGSFLSDNGATTDE